MARVGEDAAVYLGLRGDTNKRRMNGLPLMSDIIQGLPAVLIFSALVAVFLWLYAQHRTMRVRYWVIGWALMLTYFSAGIIPVSTRAAHAVIHAIQLATLPVAGLAFLISVSRLMDRPRARRVAIVLMSTPAVLYAVLLVGQSDSKPVYMLLAAWVLFGGAAWIMWQHRQVNLFVVCSTIMMVALGVAAVWKIQVGDHHRAFYCMLLACFALCAGAFVREYPRVTPGVLLSAGGFGAWAAIWGLASFAPSMMNQLPHDGNLLNVPKFFVAIGMLLTLLEDESLSARESMERANHLNYQMTRFADVTSQLLSGVDYRTFCGEVAQVITEVANFGRTCILLSGENGRLYVAGTAGISDELRANIEKQIEDRTPADIVEMCRQGQQVGSTSYRCSHEVAVRFGGAHTTEIYPENSNWQSGDEMVVLLRSSQGTTVGCISLDEPKDVERITPEEMSKIEMLANDLSVAMQSASLQRQAVQQEKLASVGQLVSGVAHELNNPLTAVMGYSELMQESDVEGKYQRELGTIRREALRMKQIIDNLLRFARQAKSHTKSASVQQVLQEAITLRDYDLNRSGVKVERKLQANLPAVLLDEAELKMVCVNVLSNAMDAMATSSEKSVTIYAQQIGGRVVLSFEDTGAGFSDVNRAFDPFFTTKGPGKGTGLGLSICYGIVKQHGGEIYARNVHPRGACVTIELPVAEKEVISSQESVVRSQ
jgi:two-component system, NtrC family, sensor kinase